METDQSGGSHQCFELGRIAKYGWLLGALVSKRSQWIKASVAMIRVVQS